MLIETHRNGRKTTSQCLHFTSLYICIFIYLTRLVQKENSKLQTEYKRVKSYFQAHRCGYKNRDIYETYLWIVCSTAELKTLASFRICFHVFQFDLKTFKDTCFLSFKSAHALYVHVLWYLTNKKF